MEISEILEIPAPANQNSLSYAMNLTELDYQSFHFKLKKTDVEEASNTFDAEAFMDLDDSIRSSLHSNQTVDSIYCKESFTKSYRSYADLFINSWSKFDLTDETWSAYYNFNESLKHLESFNARNKMLQRLALKIELLVNSIYVKFDSHFFWATHMSKDSELYENYDAYHPAYTIKILVDLLFTDEPKAGEFYKFLDLVVSTYEYHASTEASIEKIKKARTALNDFEVQMLMDSSL